MYSSILVGVDGSRFALNAARKAVELGRLGKGRVTFLYVVPSPVLPSLYDDNPAVLGALDPVNKINLQGEKDGPGILEAAGDLAAKTGVAFRTRMSKGDPADEIVEEARGGLYDLIVLGNRGLGGLKGILTGSVSSKVSHSAPCSVLVVRSTPGENRGI